MIVAISISIWKFAQWNKWIDPVFPSWVSSLKTTRPSTSLWTLLHPFTHSFLLRVSFFPFLNFPSLHSCISHFPSYSWTASFIKCSIKNCKLTSSVKTAVPAPPSVLCLTLGFNFAIKNLASDLCWSHTIYLGTGNLESIIICASVWGASRRWRKAACSSCSWYFASRHAAMVSPWKTTTWKNVSRRRMVLGWTETESRRAGWGGPSKEYESKVGWIMTRLLVVFSRLRMYR